ncbi:MAG: cupin domain-containing protein [Caulobacteraceae bacterium]
MKRPLLVLAGLAALPVIALAADAPAPVSREVLRTDKTAFGQPLAAVAPGGQVVVVRTTVQPGVPFPEHKHPYPRVSYVISGHIKLIDTETGASRDYGPGDAIVEPVDHWHSGAVIGDEPVELVAVDQIPAGVASNVIRK